MPQKLLVLTTLSNSVRSEVVHREANDPILVYDDPSSHGYRHSDIEKIKGWETGRSGPDPDYEAALFALADGWILMSPPTHRIADNLWVWWFSRLY